jgi:L-ascorbate 6-phosphate lactonase
MNEVKKYRPDVMFVCINGRLGNMDFWQARDFAREIGVPLSIPMHYGMFRHNTENPELFCELMEQIGMKTAVMEFNVRAELGGAYKADSQK